MLGSAVGGGEMVRQVGSPDQAAELRIRARTQALADIALETGCTVVAADLLDGDSVWQDRALCAQTDPEAFWPEKGGSTREAKRICGRCDVKVECLEYALAHDEKQGIWGGLSERERRKLKRRVA